MFFFKKGEFSFTYHYIPELTVFLPRYVEKVLKRLEDSGDSGSSCLSSPSKLEVLPVRYFSRVSMLGRIDMSDLWGEFQALPEEPGVKISRLEAMGKSSTDSQFL